ncbi:MAG: DUF6502 family protein [Pseudohongiellaceae bacterium]|jgi:hypothetical protein
MRSANDMPPGTPPPSLLDALEKLLRPLVRLLLSYQITYPQLTAMLKSIYVEVAEQEFQVDNKRQSDSRINLLTGIHRKDVKRLRAEAHPAGLPPATVSTGAQLIARWLGDSEFSDPNGRPRPLSTRPGSTGNTEAEFDRLVSKVVKQDIRPRVILDEWLRLGIAHLENDHVVLNTGAFTPAEGFDEKAFFFGKNLQDHIAAGTHNLLGLKPSYFDRSVYYDGLSKQAVSELGELANQLGMEALTAMNKAALAHQQRDSAQPDATSNSAMGEPQATRYRINFGIFNFNAEVADNLNNDEAESKQ